MSCVFFEGRPILDPKIVTDGEGKAVLVIEFEDGEARRYNPDPKGGIGSWEIIRAASKPSIYPLTAPLRANAAPAKAEAVIQEVRVKIPDLTPQELQETDLKALIQARMF